MNNNYLNNSTALLHFRLRTARHKKRAQYKDLDKQLLTIERERGVLYNQKYNSGWVELHPPVVRGWKRYFVLRDDVAKTKQAPLFESILSKINTTQYSYRKDFKVKKRKWGKKVYVAKEQQLLQPRDYHFYTLNFNEAERQFFEERVVPDIPVSKSYKIFVFKEPWRFALRVRPNIITKTRVRDEVVEARLQQIHNYLHGNALIRRIDRLLRGHGYSWWEGEKYNEKNPLKNKPLAAILDEYYVSDETLV